MAQKLLSGSAQIGDAGIKKHFTNFEPWQALFELTWNGLDAGASNVKIQLEENELHGLESATVLDNGDGVDVGNIQDNFGRFNDSHKKGDAAQHGSHGRGRLAFHVLSNKAKWWTRTANDDAVIEVSAGNVKDFNGRHIERTEQHPLLSAYKTGTLVELTSMLTSLPELAKLHDIFSVEFGWYLALNKDRSIELNSVEVTVPKHHLTEEKVTSAGVDFDVKVIRWENKPTSEKSYIYLLDSEGRTRHKYLSSFNQKANFYVSIYVQSAWLDNFSLKGKDLLATEAVSLESDAWKQLEAPLLGIVDKIYAEFLRLYVDAEIQRFEEQGVFPIYTGLPPQHVSWREENVRKLVRVVYMSDPTLIGSLNKKQKKVIVRLIDRLSVSNENDALYEIISGVLELDDEHLNTLAQQLKHTHLKHIISTIELLQQRQLAVEKLRVLMNEHYREVRETPDLQQIIENNTWLFGNQYETIGAEEDSFTATARNLRTALKGIDQIDISDVEDEADILGARKQTDLFLCRKIPTLDARGQKIFRCIIIEIKRPSISLNKKHLYQLEEYADIIKKHSFFASERMHFELILIGRKISSADTQIHSRLNNQIHQSELGLVSSDPRMKCYVHNWYTLLDGFDLTYGHLIESLELKRNVLEPVSTKELVEDLQRAV